MALDPCRSQGRGQRLSRRDPHSSTPPSETVRLPRRAVSLFPREAPGTVTAVEHLAARLAEIPGVEAVALGGSRASGAARPDSDWDFGLYYRGTIRADDVRALGFEGTVVEPGEWGRLINGGAWLTVECWRVDLLYIDLVFDCYCTREAA